MWITGMLAGLFLLAMWDLRFWRKQAKTWEDLYKQADQRATVWRDEAWKSIDLAQKATDRMLTTHAVNRRLVMHIKNQKVELN